MTMSVIIKLGKYIVPYLNITVALAAHRAVRAAAAVLFPSVIVYLGTGAAWTGAVLPEVVLFAELKNTFCRNPDFLIPDVKGLVILQVYAGIQPVGIQSHHFCQELPCPGNCLMFKIVAKGEITQHLKKSTMSGSLAYILDITGADALLAGGHTLSWRNLLSCKIRL